MKHLFLATAILSTTALLLSQPAQAQKSVPLSDAESTKIEAANLKLQNLQLQYQLAQAQLQKLQEQYPALQKELNDATDAARKAHNLGPDAALAQDGKSFTVAEKPQAGQNK